MAAAAFLSAAASAREALPAGDDEGGDFALAFPGTPQPAEQPASGISFGRALDIEGAPLRLAPLGRKGGGVGLGAIYKGPFAMPSGSPLRYASVTSRFGMRSHPVLGGMRFHAGMDLAAPTGSPVYSTSPGAVTAAGWCGGYGYCVALDHGKGYQTLYGHLSGIDVSPGQVVPAGSLIGRVGSTGRSTGPHLHYEVRKDGRPLDPGRLF